MIVYICDSRGVRDIYDTDGTNAIAASEPLAVLVMLIILIINKGKFGKTQKEN